MNKLALAAAVAALSVTTFTGVAIASDDDRPRRGDDRAHHSEERMERRLDRMSERLGLDETQRTQLEAIMREQHAKRMALRGEMRERVASVLTEEQRAKMESMREERQERRHARRGHGGKHAGKYRDCPQGSEASWTPESLDAQAIRTAI